MNFRGLARQKDQRRDGKFLTPQQRDWLEHQLAMERQAASARQAGHGSIWSVLTNKYVLLFAVIYAGSSATSNTLSLWMPQILKSFGLGNMETGLLNMIPFGIASVFMIFWGLRADKSGERIWSTALPLALTSLSFAMTLLTNSLSMTLLLLSLVLLGNYAIKGPFFGFRPSRLRAADAS